MNYPPRDHALIGADDEQTRRELESGHVLGLLPPDLRKSAAHVYASAGG
jgi:hypothetical protein